MKSRILSMREPKKIGQYTIASHPLEHAERFVCGYTTKEHLLLDFDKSHNLHITANLVRMCQRNWPEIGDCLISESSHDGFHCIFDNHLAWKKILHIASTLQGLQIVNRNYLRVRRFREDLTLRVSSIDRGREKSEAPCPALYVVSDYPSRIYHYTPPMKISDLRLDLHEREFSGIDEYLEVLSAFRDLRELHVALS